MPAEKKTVVMPTRQATAIYENWKVYSMHGKLMFRCNRKKAEWYLKRQLAKPCDNDPNAIQLIFEAKGQGHDEEDYMLEDRENQCVVCASKKSLTLHHVVPYVYRQWFPLTIKSKSSRDLLLLCKVCHDRYERHATTFKKQIAAEYDMPLEGKGWIKCPENRTARKAASALLRGGHDKIPLDRQNALTEIVQKFWSSYSASAEEEKNLPWEDILQRCCDLKDVYPGPDFIEHGRGVTEQLLKKKQMDPLTNKERWPDLETFIKQWRAHFVEHAQPLHLSARWTVEGEIYND